MQEQYSTAKLIKEADKGSQKKKEVFIRQIFSSPTSSIPHLIEPEPSYKLNKRPLDQNKNSMLLRKYDSLENL